MKEKIKKILLWIAFIWLISGSINVLYEIITFPSEIAPLKAEGVEVVYPELTIALNFVWLFLFGGLIVLIYKKLFPKKETKVSNELEKIDEKNFFKGNFFNKVLFISHFVGLILGISYFVIGNWKLGIFFVILAILIIYIGYYGRGIGR